MNARLAIFDMDGTLTEEPSSWEYVHRSLGIDNHKAFRLYRNRAINYSDFFKADIKAWLHMHPRLSKKDVKSILGKIPLRTGSLDVINDLRKRGVSIAVVSGGISWLLDIIAERASIDFKYSNVIYTDVNGIIEAAGRIEVIPERKDLVVSMLQQRLKIEPAETISVGDSMENGMIHRYSKIKFIIGRKSLHGEIPIGFDLSALFEYI